MTARDCAEEDLVLRDVAFWPDARKVAHRCESTYHPLRAMPELHGAAIASQAEPLAALGADSLYSPLAECYHHCAAA
eukprot:140740-Amphidinium_carterae.1